MGKKLRKMVRPDKRLTPLEVGQHVLAGFGPLVLRVELELDAVPLTVVVVFDFSLVHFVGKFEVTVLAHCLSELRQAVQEGSHCLGKSSRATHWVTYEAKWRTFEGYCVSSKKVRGRKEGVVDSENK